MKHLLNNLPTEEITRILEQYKNSLIVETKNFKNLINVKSGNVQPLLNETNPPYPVVKQPKTTTTVTTTLSPQEAQKQKQKQIITQARTELAQKFGYGKTMNLFDKLQGGRYLGVYKIGGVNMGGEWLQNIDLNKILEGGVSFSISATEESKNTKARNKSFTVRFTCGTGHALTVEINKAIGTTRDILGIGQGKVYSTDLTNLLVNGYCKLQNGILVPITDL